MHPPSEARNISRDMNLPVRFHQVGSTRLAYERKDSWQLHKLAQQEVHSSNNPFDSNSFPPPVSRISKETFVILRTNSLLATFLLYLSTANVRYLAANNSTMGEYSLPELLYWVEPGYWFW
jgi:hypothetical protein